MKIKIFSLLLVLVMAFSMLASCMGGGTGGGNTGGNTGNNGGNTGGNTGNNGGNTGGNTGNNGGNTGGNTGDNGGNTGGNTGTGGDNGGNTPADDGYNVTWAKTDITVQLTDNSNSNELSSGCRRYYAGLDFNFSLQIDNAIKARNAQAQGSAVGANVKPNYKFIENTSTKGWGGNIQDMINDAGSNYTTPDIYCNFAYDMTCAALRGCFLNLLDESYANGNNFRFVDDDYNPNLGDEENYLDSVAGEGYFYKYMESLSLTPETQLYCLASDYTIDVMRAFIVVPVNVSLMNMIEESKSAAGDMDKDGDHDIQDFYEMVWAGGWDYEALAKYSVAIYEPGSIGPSTTDITDNRVGFAIGVGSGLSSSGMLYTTSVKILNKADDGSFSYPESNYKLNEFATALNNLFKQNVSRGICTVNRDEAASVTNEEGATELMAIRQQFASNHVLFGGVIMVGSLEDNVYQGMEKNGGFGIVPVPVYKKGDGYRTLVHNCARIVAISVKSDDKFAQCSAFLDYLSRNSADILDVYYNDTLVAAVSGGQAAAQNTRMLNYIRNHVNDCFDKTYEDAIANYMGETDPDAEGTRWHGMLMSNNYQMSSFSTVYDRVLGQKQEYIRQVYEAWLGLEK